MTLDYYEKCDEPIQPQHYAFLVPSHTEPGQINRLFGGRGGVMPAVRKVFGVGRRPLRHAEPA